MEIIHRLNYKIPSTHGCRRLVDETFYIGLYTLFINCSTAKIRRIIIDYEKHV